MKIHFYTLSIKMTKFSLELVLINVYGTMIAIAFKKYSAFSKNYV